MHTLNTESFLICEKLNRGKVLLFLLGCLLNGPEKIGMTNKIRKADEGDPVEVFFVGEVDSRTAFIPPKTFQRRNYIVKIAVNDTTSLSAHLNGKGGTVEKPHSLLVGSACFIGIPHPFDGQKIHRRNINDTGFGGWKVKFSVFLFIIECHMLSISFVG